MLGIHGRNHPDRPPFPAVRINGLDHVFTPVDAEFPPVYWADGDVSPRPEKQRCVGDKGNEHCGPNPDVLAYVLFYLIMIADPTPVLSKYKFSLKSN
jgi:hypothetical protein